ncbi:MAG: hypothetical protein R3F59_17255 [Myxococcota bacterium]
MTSSSATSGRVDPDKAQAARLAEKDSTAKLDRIDPTSGYWPRAGTRAPHRRDEADGRRRADGATRARADEAPEGEAGDEAQGD